MWANNSGPESNTSCRTFTTLERLVVYVLLADIDVACSFDFEPAYSRLSVSLLYWWPVSRPKGIAERNVCAKMHGFGL